MEKYNSVFILLLLLNVLTLCTCISLKSLYLDQSNRNHDLALNCDFQMDSDQQFQGMEMRFKNKFYYYVDSGSLKEHFESSVINSSRVIGHNRAYDTTTKYCNVRNVISSASVSDDFDCLIYFSAGGIPGFNQSSRDFVPDDRSIQTTLYVYNQVSGTYKVGDDVSVHCDYRLKAKDFLIDRRVYKDNKLFYRYVNKDQKYFFAQSGVDNVRLDSDANNTLRITINPNVGENSETGGRYKCQVNYVTPDGVDMNSTHENTLQLAVSVDKI
ncbi:unnamed protein product [Oppiella nova]|uniref:Ig-like domain-containing protein n=1 Tax=Oppiella nova TaxID=334625 RepID=A0A7R9QSF3_9ACAR|nr:unnamed protein product [Oppiella nova]CAG2173305.1 unnamed protein product [Oppiella nova]